MGEIGLVYLAGLVQGVALVTFPTASSIFTSPHPQGYGFSSIYAGTSLVAGAMIVLAFMVIRPQIAKAAQVSA